MRQKPIARFVFSILTLFVAFAKCPGQGTTRLVKDLDNGQVLSIEAADNYNVTYTFRGKNTTFLVHGGGLFKTDFTQSGTEFIMEVPPIWNGFESFSTFETDDYVYFWRKHWVYCSDGTKEGTTELETIGGDILWFKEVQGRVVAGVANSDYDLWELSGRTFIPIKEIRTGEKLGLGYDGNPSPFTSEAHLYNGHLYFLGNTEGAPTSKVWRTDGTAEGTLAITNETHGRIYRIAVFKNELYFISNKSGSSYLWKLDDTSQPVLVHELGGYTIPVDYITANFFQNDEYLWFSFYMETKQLLWRSDGMTVERFELGTTSSIDEFESRGDTAVMLCAKELYSISGATTQKLGGGYSTYATIKKMGKHFVIDDRPKTSITDGTPEGTKHIGTDIRDSRIIGRKYVFLDRVPGGSDELKMFKNGFVTTIKTLGQGYDRFEGPFLPDSTIYATNMYEIWKSDLTSSGTTLLKSADHRIDIINSLGEISFVHDQVIYYGEHRYRHWIWENPITEEQSFLGSLHTITGYPNIRKLGNGWFLLPYRGSITNGKSRISLIAQKVPPDQYSITFHGKLGNRMTFSALTLAGWKLWHTDGTAEGTVELPGLPVEEFVHEGDNPRLLYNRHDTAHYYFMSTKSGGNEIVKFQENSEDATILNHSAGPFSSSFHYPITSWSCGSSDLFAFRYEPIHRVSSLEMSTPYVNRLGDGFIAPRDFLMMTGVRRLGNNATAIFDVGKLDIIGCDGNLIRESADQGISYAEVSNANLFVRYNTYISDALAKIDSLGNKEILWNGFTNDYPFSFYTVSGSDFIYWQDVEGLQRFNVSTKTKEVLPGGAIPAADIISVTSYNGRLIVFTTHGVLSLGLDLHTLTTDVFPNILSFESKGYLFFVVKNGAIVSLWRTDGTRQNTVKVSDIPFGGGNIEIKSAVGGFYIIDKTDQAIWYSDGFSDKTFKINDQPISLRATVALNEDLLYEVQRKLWIYDVFAEADLQVRDGQSIVEPNGTFTFNSDSIIFEIRNEGSNLLTVANIDFEAGLSIHEQPVFPIEIEVGKAVRLLLSANDLLPRDSVSAVIHSNDPRHSAYEVFFKNVKTTYENMVVYPNPASDYINIDAPHFNQVVITDLMGRAIKSFDNSTTRLDLTDLQDGFYMLIIKFDDRILAHRIVVK